MLTRLNRRAFILLPGVLGLLLLGCSGKDDDNRAGTLPEATWQEDCNVCGANWAIDLKQGDAGPEFTVAVANTGERGRLRLRLGELKGYALNEQQASKWRQAYPQARAQRDAIDMLEANGYTGVTLEPREGSGGTFTIDKGQLYGGVFQPKGDPIPANTVALVLLFGPVDTEITPAGQRASDFWVTWDLSRPFFTLGPDEVRVTPVPTRAP